MFLIFFRYQLTPLNLPQLHVAIIFISKYDDYDNLDHGDSSRENTYI